MADRAPCRARAETAMEIITIQPIVALIAGVLILLMPRLLNYIVALYLIVFGILGLAGHMGAAPGPM
jgi:hypothetical protein